MQSSRNDEKTQDFSILNDSLAILNNLKQQARKMDGVTDLGRRPYYGTTDEEEKQYEATRTVCVRFADSKLSKERFHAVENMLEQALEIYYQKNENSDLKVHLSPGGELLTLHADYQHKVYALRVLSNDPLEAPISKISFDEIQNNIHEILKQVFTGWKSEAQSDLLTKEFDEKNNFGVGGLYRFFSLLEAMEKTCGEIIKNFSFKRANQKIGSKETLTISKTQFEQAKKLIGYDQAKPVVSLFFKQPPAMTKNQEAAKPAVNFNPPGGLEL